MPRILVASANPVKITAVRTGFERMFPHEPLECSGVSAPSGVSAQPMSNAETFQGAWNRMQHIAGQEKNAQFWVGVEGGIEENDGEMSAFAWVVIRHATGQVGKGKTGSFFLPPKIMVLIREGKELGEADDIVFGKTNSKQENGSVGLLTGNVIDRTSFYVQAVVLALVPFKNHGLYFSS